MASNTMGLHLINHVMETWGMSHYLTLSASLVLSYTISRCVYLLYFHPLAQFPGPRIAAVSNGWYAYHSITGRLPWAIEDLNNRYGDVVRMAPNDLVFFDPKAMTEIYASKTNGVEKFLKTDGDDLGDGDPGITWEVDPVKHRDIAKKLAPAFSSKSLKAKEGVVQGYTDLFVQRMREYGSGSHGVDLRKWTDWLAMDLAAEMSYNRAMNELRGMKNAPYLDAAHAVNFFAMVYRVAKRFPLLRPLAYLFIPPSTIRTLPKILRMNKQEVHARISKRGDIPHLDYFEQLLPSDDPAPMDKKVNNHLEVVAGQLQIASYDPVSVVYFTALLFLLNEPSAHKMLIDEIRGRFRTYDEIEPDALRDMPFLNACLWETFRIQGTATSGLLPRSSPGVVVNGTYIPKGTICINGDFASNRSERYFTDPKLYRPQRWLTNPDHPSYDSKYANDALKTVFPFGQGPRMCPGREAAWIQIRLFLAKVFWMFDVTALPGQDVSFEKDFVMYGMWNKPEFWVTFEGRRT